VGLDQKHNGTIGLVWKEIKMMDIGETYIKVSKNWIVTFAWIFIRRK
jgi:hypothetical protein